MQTSIRQGAGTRISPVIVGASIIAVAVIVAALVTVYFSPTNECIREWKRRGADDDGARFQCFPHPPVQTVQPQ